MHTLQRYLHQATVVTILILLLVPTTHVAAATQNKGLLITPLRKYAAIDTGKTNSDTITVANLTEKTITITLSVEQFSVADYTYTYQFKPAKHDWVKLGQTAVVLAPHKSQKIAYDIHVPAKAPPGGQYFTIFATTSFANNEGISSRVQAATVLYVTVNGSLRKSSIVRRAAIPWISFGKNIPFVLDIKNTGNTHFFIYAAGELSGVGPEKTSEEVTHLLLPGATRTTGSTIPAPLLPGIYKATYGYRTDTNQTIQHSRYLLYIPPWSIIILLGLAWIGWRLVRRTRKA